MPKKILFPKPSKKSPLFLGEFVIDPRSEEFKDLNFVCQRGNHWKCLIATAGSIHIGRRMTVKLDQEAGEGVIGVTYGDRRYERDMTDCEVNLAVRFDNEQKITEPVTVTIDLRDKAWRSRPKSYRPYRSQAERAKGAGDWKPKRRQMRSRQLEAVQRHFKAQAS